MFRFSLYNTYILGIRDECSGLEEEGKSSLLRAKEKVLYVWSQTNRFGVLNTQTNRFRVLNTQTNRFRVLNTQTNRFRGLNTQINRLILLKLKKILFFLDYLRNK